MMPGSLARRYARALIGMASSPTQRDKFAADLGSFAALCRQEDTTGRPVLVTLTTDRFPVTQRTRMMEALAARLHLDATVVKFIAYVIERGRMEGLLEIERAYSKMADDLAGRVRAHITSARPLAPDVLGRLETALGRATGKRVMSTTSVDPELIGGVVTKVGSYVLDGSVRAALQGLRTAFRSS